MNQPVNLSERLAAIVEADPATPRLTLMLSFHAHLKVDVATAPDDLLLSELTAEVHDHPRLEKTTFRPVVRREQNRPRRIRAPNKRLTTWRWCVKHRSGVGTPPLNLHCHLIQPAAQQGCYK